MNVYMLKTTFAPEALGEPHEVQKHIAYTLSKALTGHGLQDHFHRVSQPDPEKNMVMAVVCSEEAATQLRQMGNQLGIASLALDENRTRNLQAVQHLMNR